MDVDAHVSGGDTGNSNKSIEVADMQIVGNFPAIASRSSGVSYFRTYSSRFDKMC